ncbi:MAG: ABC transporter permease [Acidimicrobiales bacterium]
MGYYIRKLLTLIPVLFVVSALSFLLLNLLPGDPVTVILGPNATGPARAELRHQLGLDQPLPQRYVHYVDRLFHGDLGQSAITKEKVSTSLGRAVPITLEILIFSQIIALILAIPLGVFSALKPGGWLDRLSTGSSFGLLSLPAFMLGVLLVYIFAVQFKAFPATGWTPLSQNLPNNLSGAFLPSLTLALGTVAVYLRVLRNDMIATLQQDFITMARAKGLSNTRILMRHAFRPSTFTLLTVAGLNVGTLIGGAVLVEVIFAIPGIGRLTIQSIYSRDYLVVQGIVLIVTIAYVLVNFAVDIFYSIIDPRTRASVANA